MISKHKFKILALTTIAILGVGALRLDDIYFEIQKNYTIFSEVYKEITLRYVDEVEPGRLMKTGIDAMLESLDPYTVLIREEDNRELDIMTRGTYAGVGIEVAKIEDDVVIMSVQEGYSAFKNGLRPGDIIIKVDGTALEGLSPEDANALMVGDAGTSVVLSIQREGQKQIKEYNLQRERIEIPNVPYFDFLDADKSILYVELARFGQNASADVKAAIDSLQKMNNGNSQGLILDFRNNPGGLLDEAVRIVDKFVEPGVEVVSIKGREVEFNESFATREEVYFDKPVIILQNQGSASASEVVAGALQDLDRAVVMGQRSYGKGLVQIVRKLSYNTALKITTSRYYIPSGRSIQAVTYTHSDEGNTVTADSLRKSFKTKNGRLVRDGKGIDPDVELESVELDAYLGNLYRGSYLFDFTNSWVNQHEDVNFPLDMEKVYEDFVEYLDKEAFSFETESDFYYSRLENSLAENIDTKNFEAKMKDLKKLIADEKEAIKKQKKEEVIETLELEILLRLKGEKARNKRALQLDKWANEAIRLMQEPSSMDRILSPASK